MLPDSWTQLRHHAEQARMWRTSKRFVAAACGRGSGKTELARRRIVRMLPIKKSWQPQYFYALPTYPQAKRVAWGMLTSLIPQEWIRKKNESDMMVETVFGSQLYVVGMDKPQRIEGTQWDGGVVDESSDQKPGVFDRTILPALGHKKGWCWRIGVPKRYGVGAPEFKKFCESDNPNVDTFSWPSEDILTPEEIELAKSLLGEQDYDEQYGANWQDISGLIFYAFTSANIKKVKYRPDLPIVIGSDFNVNPMSWVIGHRADNGLGIFDEIFLRNTNTQATLDYLYRKYGSHPSGFEFYGDATGRARRTSASSTDYLLIRNDDRFRPKRVFYPQSNPAVVDRFAASNALFRNAKGEVRCYIDPRCKHLIADLEARQYKEGTREPDDAGDIGHMTDGLGYIIHMRFPIRYFASGSPAVHVG